MKEELNVKKKKKYLMDNQNEIMEMLDVMNNYKY
jgi:hypothetical protein